MVVFNLEYKPVLIMKIRDDGYEDWKLEMTDERTNWIIAGEQIPWCASDSIRCYPIVLVLACMG